MLYIKIIIYIIVKNIEMRTLEEIVELEGLKTKSKNLKQFFYDKYIRTDINYDFLSKYPELILIFKNSKKLDWGAISMYQISEEFIREFQDKVNWNYISKYQKLSESFIIEFQDKVNWVYISPNQKLSEEFIREFQDKVNWSYISKYQKLSESFIKEFKDYVDWYDISTYQKLSESFIKEFKDKVKWSFISSNQILSKEFIKEFKDKVYWFWISSHQKLSEEFIREFKDKLDLNKIEDSWNYKDEEFKKKAIIESNLYKCHDDYFIAFKGIKSDRYSSYNFQYQYLKGETYTCHADHSNDENSFGLSVWTKEEATRYCNELVVMVKVYYKDVARMVHKNGKIRCTKINILN